MTRKVKLVFRENGVTAFATLLEDLAPETCKMLWEALKTPATNKVIHAQWAGPEVVLELPPDHRNFDPTNRKGENQTYTPLPGEIGWHYNYPYERHYNPSDYWNVAIFYGRDCYIHNASISIWAQITEGLEEFAAMCKRVRLEGLKEVTISRVGEEE